MFTTTPAPLPPELIAHHAGAIQTARTRLADRRHTLRTQRLDESGLILALADALRAIEEVHGCASAADLAALGVTPSDLARYGEAATREAAAASVRQVA